MKYENIAQVAQPLYVELRLRPEKDSPEVILNLSVRRRSDNLSEKNSLGVIIKLSGSLSKNEEGMNLAASSRAKVAGYDW